MAEISRRAGVGMATLYRNFPGRRELLEALYTDEVNAICEAAETVDGETPGAVLMAWLHRFFAFSTSKRHIASELLAHLDSSNPAFSDNRARVLAAGRPLLAAARRVQEEDAGDAFQDDSAGVDLGAQMQADQQGPD
ncbi:TetR/AcrR family transcriptional regulator [Streptomyces sp. NPDC019443]|uniref:TetR/AcrR family transcriptional regulator n=1 Tax=Streptomyces sp. NPDC019443 TaxID=3365061 RepID=UPI0037BCFB18